MCGHPHTSIFIYRYKIGKLCEGFLTVRPFSTVYPVLIKTTEELHFLISQMTVTNVLFVSARAICHGALKLDPIYIVSNTFSLNMSSIYILFTEQQKGKLKWVNVCNNC